jgi:hypothetical protein
MFSKAAEGGSGDTQRVQAWENKKNRCPKNAEVDIDFKLLRESKRIHVR